MSDLSLLPTHPSGAADVRTIVVSSPGAIALVTGTAPQRGDDEVLIHPVLVGICGTDLDIIDGTIDAAFIRYPIALGHEWSGVVVDAGDGAGTEPLSAGDRVVVEGIVPCAQCSACKSGQTNRCERYDEFGFTRNGAMGDLLVAPRRLVHHLATRVSMESGVLVEPAAVVLTGLLRISPQPGDRVLVIGDGTVGLLAATMIQLWSPSQVTMLGRRADQRPLAVSAGVDTFETDALLVGHNFDIVIEAAGAADAVATALTSTVRGGRLLLLGFPGDGVQVPIAVDDLVNGDLTIAGSFGYTSSAWAQVVALLNSGRLDLGFLITHRFPLEEFGDAIDALRHSTGRRGKVLVEIDPPSVRSASL